MLETLHNLVHKNPEYALAALAVLWWLFAAATQAMPEPLPAGSRFYMWLFNFLHILAANTKRVLGKTKLGQLVGVETPPPPEQGKG